MSEQYQKSKKIFHDNANWLLSSDIRIKNGDNKGALYGWKNLNPPSFPFIYTEITGYATTCFCWLFSEFGNKVALVAAKEASNWVIRNIKFNLTVARPPESGNKPNDLSNLFYSFDNGMIITGLLNLYKITKDASNLLLQAEKMARTLIDRFFDGEKLIARLDSSYNPIFEDKINGVIKWSTISGPYHAKLSLAFLDLSRETNDPKYSKVSNSICDYAKKMQTSEGQFITNPGSDIVFLHPHLYSCEGLIYSGLMQSNKEHYSAGLKGIIWAVRQLVSRGSAGLFRDTGAQLVEQSDCTAQLLRLLLLCRPNLQEFFDEIELNNIIDSLHLRLLDFHISLGEENGATRYQLALDTACSWCTMFSMQALALWNTKKSTTRWIEHFI